MKTCEKCGKSCFIEVEGDEIHCWCCGWVKFVMNGSPASWRGDRGRRRKRSAPRRKGRGHDARGDAKDY